jgi:hypothetical protein
VGLGFAAYFAMATKTKKATPGRLDRAESALPV